MTDNAPDPDALARAVAARMAECDRVFQHYGIRLISAAPGAVTIEVTVRDDMLNGHDICHGGLIFTLADTAMAMASNSYNQVAVAAEATISFVEPVEAGETLRAEATERSLRGRSGIYDVAVTGREGRLVGLFRGRTQRVRGEVVEQG